MGNDVKECLLRLLENKNNSKFKMQIEKCKLKIINNNVRMLWVVFPTTYQNAF